MLGTPSRQAYGTAVGDIVGSSSEGHEIAQAVQVNLDRVAFAIAEGVTLLAEPECPATPQT